MSEASYDIKPLKSAVPLSKSRFVHGKQCPLRLFYEARTDAPKDEFDASVAARIEMGRIVGEYAKALYRQRHADDYIDITADYRSQELADADTLAALSRGARAVSEAGFTFDRTKIRVDFLERTGVDSFDLIELKSGSKFDEDKHLWDVAVQLYVARGAGLNVRDVYLMHLNKSYVWEGGDYDLEQLFAWTNVTEMAEARQARVAASIEALSEMLLQDCPPSRESETDCEVPYRCSYFSLCHADDPLHPISELPGCTRVSHLRGRLDDRGIRSIEQIDSGLAHSCGMNAKQIRTWEATAGNCLIIEPGAKTWVDALAFPLHFLDFETIMPPLPQFVGTHPYETIPVQWSLHVMSEPGGPLRHCEFLVGAGQDPHLAFTKSLSDATLPDGDILMYSKYERTQLTALEARAGSLQPAIAAIKRRLKDLGEPIDDHVFAPELHGGWTIKKVAKLFARDLPGYDELDVSNGDQAMLAIREYLNPATTEGRRNQLHDQLLKYCEQDTLVMVRIYETLHIAEKRSEL